MLSRLYQRKKKGEKVRPGKRRGQKQLEEKTLAESLTGSCSKDQEREIMVRKCLQRSLGKIVSECLKLFLSLFEKTHPSGANSEQTHQTKNGLDTERYDKENLTGMKVQKAEGSKKAYSAAL